MNASMHTVASKNKSNTIHIEQQTGRLRSLTGKT